jgi:hypothetical protein
LAACLSFFRVLLVFPFCHFNEELLATNSFWKDKSTTTRIVG